jgi:hypothetical protein
VNSGRSEDAFITCFEASESLLEEQVGLTEKLKRNVLDFGMRLALALKHLRHLQCCLRQSATLKETGCVLLTNQVRQ